MINKLHTTLILSLCAVFTACSEKGVVVDEPVGGKEPIVLSVGGMESSAPLTRAVVTDGTGKTLNPFDIDSKIFMVMKSEYGTTDYSGATTTKYNVARGDVSVSENDATNHRSRVKFNAKNQRYWDDAHGRSSQLSIYAYAQKGEPSWNAVTFNDVPYQTEGSDQPFAWTTSEIVPTIKAWGAALSGTAQDQRSVRCQDLLFSNNLADDGAGNDGRLKFNFTTRKFPREGEANMVFYHAMAKITIKIIEGAGFNKTSDADFKFTTTNSQSNVILKGFNHAGTFDIKEGEFTSITSSTDISKISLASTTPSAAVHYTLEALVVPSIAADGASRIVSGRSNLASDVMIEFEIDNNLFQITHDDLFTALNGKPYATTVAGSPSYIPIEAGKNYEFTFTIKKTQIDNITAKVADWETVEANPLAPSNARIQLDVEDRSSNVSAVTSNMDIYRALDTAPSVQDDYVGKNWKTGYTVDGKATWNGAALAYNTDRWSTDWFWDSNKSYYHIRTVSPTTQVVTVDASNGDYTSIASASCSDEASYSQVAWGAPFENVEDSYKFVYSSTTGFDKVYKAIGPTKDQIKVLMFHMMSGIHITLKTTTGEDKVVLFDGTNRTRVDLVGYYPQGRVRLGTGLVSVDGTKSTLALPQNIAFASAEDDGHHTNQEYFFSAVPQGLTDVELYITTPDHNQYIVDMKDVIVSTSNISGYNMAYDYPSAGTGKAYIRSWYPNTRYNYSFTLKKKKIEDITATIADWETITADDEEVQIK